MSKSRHYLEDDERDKRVPKEIQDKARLLDWEIDCYWTGDEHVFLPWRGRVETVRTKDQHPARFPTPQAALQGLIEYLTQKGNKT